MRELKKQMNENIESNIDRLCAEVDENLAWFKEHFPEA